MKQCIFCRIVNGDLRAHVLSEDADTVAFLDAFPISQGHTLITTKRHFDRFEKTPFNLVAILGRRLHEIAPRITEAVGAQGYNLGLNSGRDAGQTVDHVHWHIIPRFSGDRLVSWPNQSVPEPSLAKTAELIRLKLQTK